MKKKVNDIIAAVLGFVGFFLALGTVGRMETDMFFPFSKAIAMMFAGFMLMAMGFVLGGWDKCE